MKIKLRLFAYLKEKVGMDERIVEVEKGATVGLVWDSFIRGQIPRQSGFRVCFAVNGEYVKEDEVLRDGDELAFIPPVSGG